MEPVKLDTALAPVTAPASLSQIVISSVLSALLLSASLSPTKLDVKITSPGEVYQDFAEADALYIFGTDNLLYRHGGGVIHVIQS